MCYVGLLLFISYLYKSYQICYLLVLTGLLYYICHFMSRITVHLYYCTVFEKLVILRVAGVNFLILLIGEYGISDSK